MLRSEAYELLDYTSRSVLLFYAVDLDVGMLGSLLMSGSIDSGVGHDQMTQSNMYITQRPELDDGLRFTTLYMHVCEDISHKVA